MSNNTIILKRSSVTGKKPTEAQLQYGELSINYADGELYYKSSANTIKAIGQQYGEAIETLKSGKLDANGTALKATSDASGNNIANTYIKGLSVNGKVITYTKGNGDTGTITTQDTTYGAATSSTLGLVKTGSNITNTSGVISLTKANVTSALGYTPPTTDTTYSAFVGASASADGSNGLVPTPVKGKQGSFLRGDGTWATPLNTTYTGSDGISLSGTNFTNSGVRSIASGTTANTLSVNTGGTTKTITINNVANATSASSATKATQDSAGQQINTTYIKGLSVLGKTITYTKGDDTTGSITTQDTTYSAGTGLSLSGTTFTNSGVRSVKAGTSANQLSVDTNGTTSTITINNVANATTASSANALSTARTITLGGDLSGSVSFDGSANVTLTATVADDSHNHTIANIDNLQTTLNAKAPLASPTFTGTPSAPTATSGTNTTQIATTAFVQSEINSKIAAADAMIFKGTIGTDGTITALPATHTTGWTYKVITAGTYAGQKCEVGDLITCLTDGTTANDSHWTVIQTNIDGAVTGPTSSVANRVAVFDGTTGKIIKDSGYTIATSVPSGAKFTDTTYSVFKGATSSAEGSTGLVPAPASGKQTSFLRGDGTWVVPTNTTYSAGAGISLSGTTFSNSGVRAVSAGSSANQISVNTNGTTSTITVNNVANATSATNDSAGNAINKTYIKGLSVNGKVITYTKGDDTTGTITTQDTTYGAATSSDFGLVKTGSNITNSSGTISLTKANVTAALGYTPPTTDTTYSAGAGIALSGTTFSNSGVRSVVAGDTANVLKVNTNGTETAITINNVANATSASSADKLSTARTIAISGGATGTATSFNGTGNISIPVTGVKEAYLEWGGKNFAGGYSPIDAAMVPDLGANRMAFANAEGIKVEYSTDDGATWVDYGLSNEQKTGIFADGRSVTVGKATGSTITTNCQLRITITSNLAKIYTVLNKFAIYVSTNGSGGCWCTIDAAPQNNNTKFTTFANKVSVTGWSGWNIINTSGITTYANNASQYQILRFTFGITSHNSNNGKYAGLSVLRIMGFGGVGWTTPSNMAKYGSIYSYDANQNVTFPAKVTAQSFSGNATSATKATQDGSGNVITSYYASKTSVSSLETRVAKLESDFSNLMTKTEYRNEVDAAYAAIS